MSDGSLNIKIGTFDEGIKNSSNPTLPTGRYHLRIKSWKIKAAQSSGAQMIQWTLEVIGPNGDQWGEDWNEELEGAVAWNNTMIEGEGIGFFWGFISALAQPNIDVNFEGETLTTEWLNSLVGLEMIADITLGSYMGRPSNSFERFISLDPVEG
jgi:hypothetical protein